MAKSIIRILVVLSILGTLASSASAGKYQVAYWRELGGAENQAPPFGTYGMHDVWIHVWNEDGTPRANVPIRNTSYYNWGVTNSHGILHVQLWSSASDFVCDDGVNAYEACPIFDERRAPHYGHYSWEVGFIYRSSSTPAELFDMNYFGVLNSSSSDHCDISAPCSRSFSFVSVNPDEACSDPFMDGPTVTEAGQTFVATGDRVIAAKAWVGASSGYKAEILSGGPNGTVIGSIATATAEAEYQQVLAMWPFNAVQVVPGNTYYLRITSLGGTSFTCKRTMYDNYSGGCFYANKSAYTGSDLMGGVIVAWSGYGSGGRIAGRVRDVTGAVLAGSVVTVNPGNRTAQVDSNGYYTIFDVPAGTYTVTATKWGYSDQTLTRQVTAGATKTVNFDSLKALVNVLSNPGFESSLTSWTKVGSFNAYNSGDWAVPSHSGSKFAGNITSGGVGSGKLYQQVSVSGDYDFAFSTWYLTDAFNGDRTTEFPTDNFCQIGIDPTGSTNPYSSTIVWSPQKSSQNQWSQVSMTAKAQPPYAQMTLWLNYSMPYAHDWNKAAFDDVFFGRSVPVVVVDTEPVVTSITSNSARVSWRTNVASNSRVDYGPTTAYGQNTTVSDAVTFHGVNLSGLAPNTTYHFKVTSAATGYDPGSSTDYTFATLRAYTPVASVADLAGLADGTDVSLTGKLVVGGVDQLGSMFYIQENGGLAGVRVNSTDTAIHEGDRRDVYGTLATVDGERCINCISTSLASSGNAVPAPFGIRLDCLGGPAAGQTYGIGTVAMLVRTWGVVSAGGSDYFYLNGPNGRQVKVLCGALIKPTGFATVTGCCGKTLTGGPAPVVRARKQSDITPYP